MRLNIREWKCSNLGHMISKLPLKSSPVVAWEKMPTEGIAMEDKALANIMPVLGMQKTRVLKPLLLTVTKNRRKKITGFFQFNAQGVETNSVSFKTITKIYQIAQNHTMNLLTSA